MKTDLIIIGSGPGGYRAAEHAAKNGLQVVIFEREQAGGTCLNCGCIPTKSFCHAASLEHKDYTQALTHKNEVVEQLRAGVEQLMTMPGITFVRGTASFKDAETVVCNGNEYTAPHIIIATGSKPKLPPFVKNVQAGDCHHELHEKGGPAIVTSTELLDYDHIPQHLVIIGAGVIGMEFAGIFNAFGSHVTVIEFLKECLPAIDSDIAKRLRKSMEKSGVEFYMQASVQQITKEGVTFERKGKAGTIPADVVLIATGRQPNTEGLNLEAAGIAYDRNGITVDPDSFEVQFIPSQNNPHSSKIYAIGDVNGQTLLAHAATMQGIKVVNNILNRKDAIRLAIMPAAVFTTPEVASVGMTEDQCKEQGIEYICKKGLYRSNGKALAMNDTDGILKLITTPLTTDGGGKILGCHIMGAHAADIVQEIAVLMNFDATVRQLRDIVHIHPTLGEILQTTAENF
ncbi:MAG: dihydrolipoyl dehydrogenase [Prevotella sp.]|nr:dihydrolipoyl dehydrogenase [Prevotella sp.]